MAAASPAKNDETSDKSKATTSAVAPPTAAPTAAPPAKPQHPPPPPQQQQQPPAKRQNIGATTQPLVQMPARHSWELDWLSTELVKARQEIKRLKSENDALRIQLAQRATLHHHQQQFVHPPPTSHLEHTLAKQHALDAIIQRHQPQQQAALELTKQQAIDAILKANNQSLVLQQALQQALHQAPQHTPTGHLDPTSPYASIAHAAAIPTTSHLNLAQQLSALQAQQQQPKPAAQNLQDLQKQMLGPSNFEDLRGLVDHASAGSGRMDMSKVEKLLLAVQAENAAKNKE